MKSLFSGTVRERNPEETLRSLSSSMELFDGWVSVSDDSGLCPVGSYPIYQVRSRLGDMIHTTQGKGETHLTSLVSAWMENLENRYLAGINQTPAVRNKSYSQLKTDGKNCVDPVLLCSAKPPQELCSFLRNETLNWSYAYDINDGSPVLVPSARLFSQPISWWNEHLFPLSNGLASGNSKPEAIAHGLLELIERQSRVYSLKKSEALRTVCHQSLPEPLYSRVKELEEQCESFKILDLSHNFNVPCFETEIILRPEQAHKLGQGDLRFYTGSGAHSLPEVAILRAVSECIQTIACLVDGIKENVTGKTPSDGSNARPTSQSTNINFDQLIALPETNTFEEEIDQLVARIRKNTDSQILVYDYKVPNDSLDVAIVLIPGFTYPASIWMEE